jgi:hypothetical protein
VDILRAFFAKRASLKQLDPPFERSEVVTQIVSHNSKQFFSNQAPALFNSLVPHTFDSFRTVDYDPNPTSDSFQET